MHLRCPGQHPKYQCNQCSSKEKSARLWSLQQEHVVMHHHAAYSGGSCDVQWVLCRCHPSRFCSGMPEQQALRQSLLFMLMKLLLSLLHLVTASPLVPGFGSAGGRHLQECAACPGLADYIQALAADFFPGST